jgi:hypothetical protein
VIFSVFSTSPGGTETSYHPLTIQTDVNEMVARPLPGRNPVPCRRGVSYGHEWTTPTDTVLALLPVGYPIDGVPRRLGSHPSGVGGLRVLLAG